MPIAVFVGERDMLADKEDNDVFTANIKNLVEYQVLKDHDHTSLTSGRDMSYF